MLTWTILYNNGSNQPMLHSQWLSRNVNILLEAKSAPFTRDRIKPEKDGINDVSQGMHWVWTIIKEIFKRPFKVYMTDFFCLLD